MIQVKVKERDYRDNKGSSTRPYENKNRLNRLPFNILRVLSKSPHEPFIIAYIRKKTGRGAWDYLQHCLDLLVQYDCVECTPKEKSKIGHNTYMITKWGLTVIKKYDSNDQITQTIRALERGAVREYIYKELRISQR